MSDLLKMGIGRYMLPVPATIWRRQVARGAVRLAASLRFMSEDHHRVRYFVVRELPARAAPIPPALIAGALDLPLERVNAILRDLEEHLTFIFRNERGEVAWAYPVTADATPHRVTFSTGERIYAA